MTELHSREVMEKKLQEFLRVECYLNDKDIELENKLFSNGLLSSLDLLDLTCFLEREYGIVIEPSETSIEHLDSIALICEFVARKTVSA